MIVVLTGNNSFLLKTELNNRVKQFVEKYTNMGVQRFDGEEVGYDQIREALESLPFLSPKKMVVLRRPGANKEFVDKAADLLANLSDTTDLIIYEPKLDKRSAYYKFLKKNTDYQEFYEMDQYGLAKWLISEAKRQGATFQTADAAYLIERVGPNQLMLSSELAKLITYDLKITRDHIDMLVEPTPQSTIFELLDAAFAGNVQKVLTIYQEQRASKVEPQQIVAMLAWQLHIFSVVKTAGNRSDSEIAAEAKISPYVVSKSRHITQNLTLPKLKQLISELLKLDIRMKTTAIDADDALQAYLLHLSG